MLFPYRIVAGCPQPRTEYDQSPYKFSIGLYPYPCAAGDSLRYCFSCSSILNNGSCVILSYLTN